MEGDRDVLDAERFAAGQALDAGVGAQAELEDTGAFLGAEVAPAAGAGVVAVGVRDEGTLDRPPGVDMEIAWRAIESVFRDTEHGCGPEP
jgi:hypothetical protein